MATSDCERFVAIEKRNFSARVIMVSRRFFSLWLIQLRCWLSAFILVGCAGSQPCTTGHGLSQESGGYFDAQLDNMRGRTFGGYINWHYDSAEQDTEQEGHCVVHLVSQDDSMHKVHLLAAYHCLRDIVLKHLSSGKQERQISLTLDMKHNTQCTDFESVRIVFDIDDSLYLSRLKKKFEDISRENIIELKQENFGDFKKLDAPWLESFAYDAEGVRQGDDAEHAFCSTLHHHNVFKNLVGKGGEKKEVEGACYLYSDLAYVDLNLEGLDWGDKETPRVCLNGFVPEGGAALEAQIYSLPHSEEVWVKTLRDWQLNHRPLSDYQDYRAALKDQHRPHQERMDQSVISLRFNHGVRADDAEQGNADDDTVKIKVADDLRIWTKFKENNKNYIFTMLNLSWDAASDLLGTKQVWGHVYGILKREWGYVIMYDKTTYKVSPGSSGSVLSLGQTVLGALYSVSGKEKSAAGTSPVEGSMKEVPRLVKPDKNEDEVAEAEQLAASGDDMPSPGAGGQIVSAEAGAPTDGAISTSVAQQPSAEDQMRDVSFESLDAISGKQQFPAAAHSINQQGAKDGTDTCISAPPS